MFSEQLEKSAIKCPWDKNTGFIEDINFGESCLKRRTGEIILSPNNLIL